MDNTGLRPKQVEVATLSNLKCFGESALLIMLQCFLMACAVEPLRSANSARDNFTR